MDARIINQENLKALSEKLRELQSKLQLSTVILPNKAEPHGPSMIWLICGVAGLLLEAGFAYMFTTEILRWDTTLAVIFSACLVIISAVTLALPLDRLYDAARKAKEEQSELIDDVNVLSKQKTRHIAKAAEARYLSLEKSFIWTAIILIIIGFTALGLERAWLLHTESEELSLLTYIWNLLLPLGGALASATAFHHYSKGRQEAMDLKKVTAEIEELKVTILDLKTKEISNGYSKKIKHGETIGTDHVDHAQQ